VSNPLAVVLQRPRSCLESRIYTYCYRGVSAGNIRIYTSLAHNIKRYKNKTHQAATHSCSKPHYLILDKATYTDAKHSVTKHTTAATPLVGVFAIGFCHPQIHNCTFSSSTYL
jgi:hypothetical protein